MFIAKKLRKNTHTDEKNSIYTTDQVQNKNVTNEQRHE